MDLVELVQNVSEEIGANPVDFTEALAATMQGLVD
jgi:hypothetical protein